MIPENTHRKKRKIVVTGFLEAGAAPETALALHLLASKIMEGPDPGTPGQAVFVVECGTARVAQWRIEWTDETPDRIEFELLREGNLGAVPQREGEKKGAAR